MFDDLIAHYHENVVNAYIDYRETSMDGVAGRGRDLRKALAAANALFHFREHITKDTPTRADIETLSPEYALLGDIVNASKHKAVKNKTPHGDPLISDASQIKEELVITEYEDGEGEYRFAQKFVVVTLSDGSEKYLIDLLTTVINFWEGYLHSIGALASARTFVHSNVIKKRSREESEKNKINFEIVQGHRFMKQIKIMRYNYETKKAEPIDLTGSQLKFCIYKPQKSVTLTLKNDKTGEEYQTSVKLSEEETQTFSQLSTPLAIQVFVEKLSVVQEAYQKLATEAGLPLIKKEDQ